MVGKRKGFHTEFLGALYKFIDAREPVKKAVVAVDMELCKLHTPLVSSRSSECFFDDFFLY